MSKERPVRAGAPSYGQPVSKASNTFEQIQEEDKRVNPGLQREKINSPDTLRHAGIVDKITLSFRGNSERTGPTVEKVLDLSTGELSDVVSHDINEDAFNEVPEQLDLYA